MVDKVLFVCGSLNQTTIMHKISQQLPGIDPFFTPYFAEGAIGLATSLHLTDFTILGGRHKAATMQYLQDKKLPLDIGNKAKNYDLVVIPSDLVTVPSLLKTRLMLVQEGMLEKPGLPYELARRKLIPRWAANTACMGLSGQYDRFCVGSEGYRQLFIKRGVDPAKLVVTGIPNFDNAAAYLKNDFPRQGYVLVATSSIRETLGSDKRMNFLLKVKQIAKGREIIFKLHPNEDPHRAIREIRQFFPRDTILINGNLHEMIANCAVFIAQNSSAIFTALALGKLSYSDLDHEELMKLLPVQNQGQSARLIAEQCLSLLATPLETLRFMPKPQAAFGKPALKPKKAPLFKLPAWFS